MLRRRRLQNLANIRVVGVGRGGVTAVNHMIAAGVSGVDFVTVDADAEALQASQASISFHVEGAAGGTPGADGDSAGARAETSQSLLGDALAGSDMVFLVGGLGGKTGTRLAPLVAAEARRCGALATAIVTFPFSFEGEARARRAQQGIRRLKEHVNTLIVVPNDRLLKLSGGEVAFHETYHLALEIWRQSIQGISELVNAPGLVNVDFADVRAIMAGGGASIIAAGRGSGPHGAREAAQQATRSPYLDVTIDGARGVLFNVTGGLDMSLHEINQAAAIIKERAHPEANIIFGAAVDVALEEEIRITLIATGCGFELPFMETIEDGDPGRRATPVRRRGLSSPLLG